MSLTKDPSRLLGLLRLPSVRIERPFSPGHQIDNKEEDNKEKKTSLTQPSHHPYSTLTPTQTRKSRTNPLT